MHSEDARCSWVAAKHYVPEIDGLRAVAIGLVLVCHYAQSGAGWMGVDLFFVLSGFLITGICLDHRGPGFFRAFYARRALRIVPIYALAVAALLLPSILAAGRLPDGWLWLATFTTNIGIAHGAAIPSNTNHLWSLAVEEQFYLVWPFLVAMLATRWTWVLACVALPIALAFRVALVVQGDTIGPYVLTVARMDTLAVGALLAFAVRKSWPLPGFLKRIGDASVYGWSFALLAVYAVVSAMGETSRTTQTVGYSGIALLCGIPLGATLAANPQSSLRRVLRARVLQAVGKRSYAIYLLHVLIMPVLGRPSTVLGWIAFSIGATGFTYGLAALTWCLIERPALDRKASFPYGTSRSSSEPVLA